MSISFAELDSIMISLESLLNAFSGVASFLSLSVNEILAFVGLPVELPSWIGGDLSPLALMLGIALPAYIAYQFISWILNIIT